jgi:hypothetical protein
VIREIICKVIVFKIKLVLTSPNAAVDQCIYFACRIKATESVFLFVRTQTTEKEFWSGVISEVICGENFAFCISHCSIPILGMQTIRFLEVCNK